MAFPTRLTKVGDCREHFNERTGMCYHQTPPWVRVVAHVGDAGQAKPHLEHNPLSLLGTCHAMPLRKLKDPAPCVCPMQAMIPFAHETCYNRRTAPTCEHIRRKTLNSGH